MYSKYVAESIVLVYLGRRGGGSLLLSDLMTDLSGNYKLITVTAGDIQGVSFPKDSINLFLKTPHAFVDLVNLFKMKEDIKSVLRKLLKFEVSKIVFVMPQIFDLYFAKKIKKANMKIAYVIHDHKSHKGEYWPRKSSVAARIKISDHVFFLSEYVYNMFPATKNISSVSNLQSKSDKKMFRPVDLQPVKDYFLIAGRMKGYKNLGLALVAWERFGEELPHLVIAGDGASSFFQEEFLPKKVIILDRWLQDPELYWLIENAKGVLLPYTEATQSGILAIAISLGVPALVTDVGGLKKQSSGAENMVLAFPDPNSFSAGIKKLQAFKKQSKKEAKKMEISERIIEWYAELT